MNLRLALMTTGLVIFGCSREPQGVAQKAIDAPVPLAGTTDSGPQFLSPIDLADKADVPIFPGAEVPNGRSNVRIDGGKTRYEIVMTAKASIDSILKFYEKTLKSAERMPGRDNVMGMTPKGHFASVQAKQDGVKSSIVVVVTDEK